MEKAILYKILQRRFKYRNPTHLTELPSNFIYSKEDYLSARQYILNLSLLQISFCHPEHQLYPRQLLRMKEPPLFFEYIGEALWMECPFLAVVGSREISPLTESWMKSNLPPFIQATGAGIVSGGARGVDQLAHQISIKEGAPTVFVLPSGLLHLYPDNLDKFKNLIATEKICFFSEFEINQKLNKSHFYFRNRTIAAFGNLTLVTQASLKSGSLLTVHHSLEIGRRVTTVPSHPEITAFAGNLKILQEGAERSIDFRELHVLWKEESCSN